MSLSPHFQLMYQKECYEAKIHLRQIASNINSLYRKNILSKEETIKIRDQILEALKYLPCHQLLTPFGVTIGNVQFYFISFNFVH